jgi:myo-inositol-1(or 4)-monophosphatase
MSELELAQKAARTGGEIVARYFRDGVEIRTNERSYDLVTDADLESELAIVRVIKDLFPDHNVLGEEAHQGSPDSEHLWVIDPLDGTNNFAHGLPHFAVSVAYYRNGQPMCGTVYNPIRGDWYVAARGQGAYYNGQNVQVAESRSLDEALIGLGFYYPRGAMMEATLAAMRDLFAKQIHGIRRFGSASLDLCQVGAGALGVFFEYELAAWDFAAGRLFVEEAGGVVTTCRGEALPLAKSSVLATNGHLHTAALEIVRHHVPNS